MYIPQTFQAKAQSEVIEFIRKNPFGILVSGNSGGMSASHLPFLLEEKPDGTLVLISHMAKANSQWQNIEGPVLVIFSGPHAYISPSWYDEPNSVPTWNYVAVHATGTLKLADEMQLPVLLEKMVGHFEGGSGPWKFNAGSEFFQNLSKAIVGFEIHVENLEGKWKLSQNHPMERRTKVVRALEKTGRSDELEIALLMRKNLSAE